MIKIKTRSFFIVLLFLVQISCSKNSDGFTTIYHDHQQLNHWNNYLLDVGYQDSADNIIILLVRTVDCEFYYDEIKWWNRNFYSDEDIDLILVVLEKYEGYYQSALNNLEIQIPSYQDKEFSVLENELLSSVPFKIYINKKQEKIVISKMGSIHSIENFLKFVQN